MESATSAIAIAVLILAVVALKHLGNTAARRIGTVLRGKWLGLLIFVAICLGAAIFCLNLVVSALFSGEIHCFGRYCSGSYQLANNPAAYWVAVATWSFFGGFFVWVIFPGIKRFARLRAGEP